MEIPDGWQKGRVDNFIKLQRGFDLTKKNSVEGPYPVYSSSGISYYHNAFKVEPPGIVTGRKGSVGPVYYITENFWPHDTSLWVSDFKNNLPKYIWYFLQSLKLERFDESSSVPTLNRNNVHRIKVVFPSFHEQKRITEILGTWDRAIEATEALITASEAQKKALMQQLLTGKRRLPGFEGAWKEVKLGDIFQFKKGQGVSKKAVAKDGVFPCVLYGELYTHYGDVIRAVKSATNSNEGIPSVVGDVLIPASTTTTGIDLANATAVLEDGIRLGGDINVLRPLNTNTDSRFMARLLTYAETFKLARRAQGSTIVHLYGSHLKDIVVFVPSHAEQVEISNAIDLSEQPIQALQAKLQTLKTEKAALMQQLLTGKRRVKLTEAAA